MIHNLNQPQELMVQLFLRILQHLHDEEWFIRFVLPEENILGPV
jgi:hypothetical protein